MGPNVVHYITSRPPLVKLRHMTATNLSSFCSIYCLLSNKMECLQQFSGWREEGEGEQNSILMDEQMSWWLLNRLTLFK